MTWLPWPTKVTNLIEKFPNQGNGSFNQNRSRTQSSHFKNQGGRWRSRSRGNNGRCFYHQKLSKRAKKV